MKKIVSFLAVSVFLFGCSSSPSEAEIGQYTTIEVEKVYDAGTVAKGEVVDAAIKIKNTGDYPLVIASVKEACSCTISSYPEEPIAPGATGTIDASVDTDKTGKGVINKPIAISANTRPSTTTVMITAKVID
jgi:hypothetical protein